MFKLRGKRIIIGPPRAVAKFLNAFLKIVLAAGTKILRATLRSGDAHGFRGSFRSRTVKGQRRNVIAISILHATQHARSAAARQRGECAVQCEALKSAPCRDQRREVSQALILLSRSQNQFRVKFSAGSFRLQHDFLRLRREAHEFDAHDIASTRQTHKRVCSSGAGGHGKLLTGEGIRRGNSYAGQRGFSGPYNAADFK